MFAIGNTKPKTFSTVEAAEDFGVNERVNNLCEKMGMYIWKRRTRLENGGATHANRPRGWVEVTNLKNPKDEEEFEEIYIYNGKNPSSLFTVLQIAFCTFSCSL